MIFCAEELFFGLTKLILRCIKGDRNDNHHMEVVRKCLRPFLDGFDIDGISNCKFDGMLWYKDLGQHINGEFSMAVVQANGLMEDQSQLESGPLSNSFESGPFGTFVGVYDGHGGPQASKFVNNNLFHNLKRFASEHEEISPNVIKKAFLATDDEFLSMVRKQWMEKPELASVGTCCLVGIICDGMLYIANAGDSRVVLGTMIQGSREIRAVQLSNDHNAKVEHERDELHALHPNDSDIVVIKHKAWRVKGIIQVTRSMGDAYLKKSEFNREPLLPKYRVPEPFDKPIMRAEPVVTMARLQPEDRFLVFASDGLYEHLNNHEVVDIVQNNPRNGIARRLVRAALQEAARKRELRYTDLQRINPGVRRHFHDDITVIVVFLDHVFASNGGSPSSGLPLSIKGGSGIIAPTY